MKASKIYEEELNILRGAIQDDILKLIEKKGRTDKCPHYSFKAIKLKYPLGIRNQFNISYVMSEFLSDKDGYQYSYGILTIEELNLLLYVL